MQLPKGLSLGLMQTRWAAMLDVLLGNPSLQNTILSGIDLVTGANTINHGLGRSLQGWRIVRQRGVASLYDTQDNNPRPMLTLQLMSSAPVTVDIEVF